MNTEIKLGVTKSRGYEEAKLELVKIETTDNGQKLVSGRELHEILNIGVHFSTWMKRMCEYGFEENTDFSILKSGNPNGGIAKIDDYVLTLEMAKHIAMVQRTEIGMKVRNYFIECEKVAHNPYAHLSQELQMMIKLEQSQTQMDQRLVKLENTMTIDYSQQETLKSLVGIRVYELLGSAEHNQKLKRKLFQSLYKHLKKVFEVNSYKNVAVKEFERAKQVIAQWEPDEITQYAIDGVKAQMRLGELYGS